MYLPGNAGKAVAAALCAVLPAVFVVLSAGYLTAAAAQDAAQDGGQGKAAATSDEAAERIVNCYDSGRDLIRRVPAWRCEKELKGEIVGDEKARAVRQRRINRARRDMTPAKPVFRGLRMVSSGTGFFVSRAGDMVTNNHVVAGCTGISAKPTRSRVHLPAKVVATDEPDDLAVIRFSRPAPSVARFRKPLNLAVGDKIAVIGHPLHGLVAIKPIFVTGTVSDFRRADLARWGRVSIDADVRHGNSGGPVIDDRAYVVGVVSAKVNTPAMYQRTGEVLRDIGLMIRQDRVLRFLERYDIAYLTGNDRPVMDDARLAAIADTFVARVGCWK